MEKAKIFMVDDDSDLVEVVKRVFEAEGYAFSSAGSAKEALDIMDDVKPDLIILDVMMEDVVAGFRVVNALRKHSDPSKRTAYGKVPILMLTSVQRRTKMKFDQDAGTRLLPIDSFMEKPIMPRVLLDKVSELLNK